jgi:hypothetical protein
MASELRYSGPMSDIDLYLSMLESGAAEAAEPLVAPINVLRWFGDDISIPQTSASTGPVRHSNGVYRR